MFCVFALINHSLPVSLVSFILPYKAVYMFFFLPFILKYWLHHLYTIFLQQRIVSLKNEGEDLMKTM